MYQEAGINIEPVIAGLMCSAIISDTLIFKSPTCTPDDIEAAMELADIAGIDPEVYGRQMFGAGSNLDEKTDREIFYQDFKKFAINDVTVGVGQVNAMGPEDIEKIKAKEVDVYKRQEQGTCLWQERVLQLEIPLLLMHCQCLHFLYMHRQYQLMD